MNPINIAWAILKNHDESPLEHLSNILNNDDILQLEADHDGQPYELITQHIKDVIDSVAIEHGVDTDVADAALDLGGISTHGGEGESASIDHLGEFDLTSMRDSFKRHMSNSPLSAFHSDAPSREHSGYAEYGRCYECREPLDEDEDCVNRRCSEYYGHSDAAEYDSTDSSERGENAYGDIRPMTERGMRRHTNRTGEQEDTVRGLAAPLTAASQGEGRVGPDVMSENQLIRYQAPQLREMILHISQELTRRGAYD